MIEEDEDGLSILYIKFKTGDDIISQVADVEDDDVDGDVILFNPMKLDSYVNHDVDPPRQLMYLQPWLPMGVITNNAVVVYMDDILTYSTVTKSFRDHYIVAVTENLEYADEEDESQSKAKQPKAQKIGDNVFTVGFGKKTETAAGEDE